MRMFALLLGAGVATAPLMAQDTTQPATGATGTAPAATASTTASVTAGAAVADTAGGAVGTIESVSDGVAVLSTGTNKVQVPVTSFAKGTSGLVIGLTKADIDAKASAAAASAATASTPAEIAAGAAVVDQTGAKIGTVKSVSGDMVTVASATASAQLPKASFAKGPSGLVIGMTPAQFDAAAKAAGGAKATTAN